MKKKKFSKTDKIIFVGDIHSSLHSLFQILLKIKDDYFENVDEMKLKKNHYIFFLGDLVDRGPFSLEILLLILNMKLSNKNNIFILNGNHENYYINSYMGLLEEIKYENMIDRKKTFQLINTIFNKMPECIFIEIDGNWYQLSHGTFDVEENYTYIKDFLQSEQTTLHQKTILKPTDISGYKWNDINMSIPLMKVNVRGSMDIGSKTIQKYLKETSIQCILKGHQDLESINIALKKNKELEYNVKKSLLYNCYELFTPIQDEFNLKDQNIHAYITSTASESRQLRTNYCYLETTNNKMIINQG